MSKILIVDDDHDFLEGLKLILDTANLGYIATATSDNVHKKAKIYRPNLMILDIYLKKANGIKVAQELKKHIDTKFIPILLISSSEKVAELYHEANAQAYLHKPFSSQELISTISRLVGKHEGNLVVNGVAKAAY